MVGTDRLRPSVRARLTPTRPRGHYTLLALQLGSPGVEGQVERERKTNPTQLGSPGVLYKSRDRKTNPTQIGSLGLVRRERTKDKINPVWQSWRLVQVERGRNTYPTQLESWQIQPSLAVLACCTSLENERQSQQARYRPPMSADTQFPQ